MALGLPQWLPLTDAEEMIAKHMAAAEESSGCDAAGGGPLCTVPRPRPLVLNSGSDGRQATPSELELDLDCWQVLLAFFVHR